MTSPRSRNLLTFFLAAVLLSLAASCASDGGGDVGDGGFALVNTRTPFPSDSTAGGGEAAPAESGRGRLVELYPTPSFSNHPDCGGIDREQLELAEVVISDGVTEVTVIAEVADQGPERNQGLMCREMIPAGTGMYFDLGREQMRGFWMFNTYSPLDIIYFGGSGGEVAVRQMVPCPRADDEVTSDWQTRCILDASAYSPDISYSATLELPAGWLESQRFDVTTPGDIVVSLAGGR